MSDSPASTAPQRALTLRAVFVALVLAWISTVWMRQDEIVSHTIQLGESVPVVPAVAALVLFLLLNPLLALVGRPLGLGNKLALTRGELVVVFVILSITPTLNSVGLMRMLLPALNVAYYYQTPENHLDKVWNLVPKWYGPRDPTVIRQMYEGAPNEQVPWGPWLQPLLLWGLFCLAFFVCMLSLNALLRKQWSERERLTFPLVQFEAALIPDRSTRIAAILRNPLFWIGFGISFLFNLLNMLHAVNPSVPAPGVTFDLGSLFTERPWSAIQPLNIYWRPDLFGLGFLMSTEITFSIWVFYLLVRLSKVFATMGGVADQMPGFPFDPDLATGSYLALTVFVLFVARKHLAAAFRTALGRGNPELDADEPMSYRLACFGFFGGFAFMIIWAILAGMTWWLALLFFGIVVGMALTYTRIRAETGAPMVWLFPYWQQQKFITNLFGSAALAPGKDFRPLTILHGFAWLSRGYYPTSSASQIEAFKLGDEANVRRHEIVRALLIACVVGMAMAYWAHLTAYYKYGGNVLEGGSTEGGYRISLMTQAHTEVASWMDKPLAPDARRNWASLVGLLVTLVLIVLRTTFLRFPLHPLAFPMTLSHPALWGPSLIIWVIKTAVLRVGGVRLYKQLIPLFIGIVLGHFFTAGIIWGTIAVFNEDLTERYGVWFG